MPRLIALALPPGPGFVAALRQAWDDGDAVLPIDPRLPGPAKARLLEELRPAVLVDENGAPHGRSGSVPVDDGDALVMATSGSTGEPKGVVLTHTAVAASAEATSARLGIDPARDRWLCCLPLNHVGGLSVITRALHTGTPFEVLPRFDPAGVAGAVRRGATRTSFVTAMLARLDARAFRTILLGGAAPPEHLPANAVVTYGMTETGSGIVYDGVPLGGVEVRLHDGEIQVRGPMLFRCYRGGAHGFTGADPLDADGWFATDDAGSFAADGRLVVHGRRHDLIVTGGENVWPVVVERRLAHHPQVREVLIEGRSDPVWGASVAAVIVPADPAAPPLLADLREWVKTELPAFCAPRSIDLVASLPRTSSGKVRRTNAAKENPGNR